MVVCEKKLNKIPFFLRDRDVSPVCPMMRLTEGSSGLEALPFLYYQFPKTRAEERAKQGFVLKGSGYGV